MAAACDSEQRIQGQWGSLKKGGLVCREGLRPLNSFPKPTVTRSPWGPASSQLICPECQKEEGRSCQQCFRLLLVHLELSAMERKVSSEPGKKEDQWILYTLGNLSLEERGSESRLPVVQRWSEAVRAKETIHSSPTPLETPRNPVNGS